jgi:hypothetical protein
MHNIVLLFSRKPGHISVQCKTNRPNNWVSGVCPSSGTLKYRTMDKVQKPSNSECYTPSLEPFRIYKTKP